MAAKKVGYEKAMSVMLEAIPRIEPEEITWVAGAKVDRGSFGDVRKAEWQGKEVAVKMFFVADKKGGISEEVSWRILNFIQNI